MKGNMRIGYIPENITFYCQAEKLNINVEHTNTVIKDIFNSFPIDPVKDAATAKKWAIGYGKNSLDQPIQFFFKNEPIKNVKIVQSEDRYRGNTVYKAIVRDRFYVDLSSETLMDIISNSSIVNGVIQCEMVFVKQNSMKLIRYGGAVYNEFVKKEIATPIKISDIKPGNYYRTNRATFAYLSDKQCVEINIEEQWKAGQVIKTKKYFDKFYFASEIGLDNLATQEISINEDKHNNDYVTLYLNNKYFYFSNSNYYVPDQTSKAKIWHVGEIDSSIYEKILENIDSLIITEEEISNCQQYLYLVYNITKILDIQETTTNEKFKFAIDYVNKMDVK
jgi:hypothetical protein